jgi:hypothetical protein
MQKFTQKYTLIQLLENMKEGTKYASNNWPLHSTIVDTFAIDWDVPTMVSKLTELLKQHEPATSVAQEDEFFGPEKQIQVVLFEKTDSLVKLHHDVAELLEQGGLQLHDPQFAREGFRPHATVQKHTRLKKGDAVTFNALTIIDMFPDEDPYQRKALHTIKIG